MYPLTTGGTDIRRENHQTVQPFRSNWHLMPGTLVTKSSQWEAVQKVRWTRSRFGKELASEKAAH
jgi:hypothetical protein